MVRKAIGIGTLGCLVALLAAGLSFAQPPQRGNRGQGAAGMRNFDPERMQQMMQQRMQEQLGVSDAEWTILGPRLMKVMNLSRQVNAGPGGMFRMGMGRRGGPQGDQPGPGGPGARGPRGPFGPTEPTEVDKASDALETTLENAAATPEEIKAKLTALRAAKEKAKAELATAQKDLREVLSLRQEAQLVLMGMLN